MRAVHQTRYCLPDQLVVRDDVPKPQPAGDEVVVRVHAASLHADAWHAITGVPGFLRLMGNGLRRPKPHRRVPGSDFAGVVEAIGTDVTSIKPGDAVLGESLRGHQWVNGGTYAEFVAAPAERVVLKPESLTFEEAATIPTAGLIATDVLLAQGRLQRDKRVLINGAGGALGCIGIQIAKAWGAHVTAVDAAAKASMMTKLGADATIDYRAADFADSSDTYDLIVDIPGGRPWRRIEPLLTDGGRYVLVGHDGYGQANGRWIGAMRQLVPVLVRAPFSAHLSGFTKAEPVRSRLELLVQLAADGQLTPLIDSSYGLDEVAAAFRRLASQEALGRVVLRCS